MKRFLIPFLFAASVAFAQVSTITVKDGDGVSRTVPTLLGVQTSAASIDTKTPALGQALAAGSTPVVLTAAQVAALTPPTTIAVSNLPATQPVSGTVAVTGAYQATQPVSLASSPLPTGAATETSLAAVNSKLGAALPLPTGAASETTLAAVNAKLGAALPLSTGAATETTLAALNTKTPALGSAVSASSSPVVIASDQAAIPFSNPVATASGTITTQNLAPTGTATASSAVEITLAGANALLIQTVGTYTGALSLQVTADGTNWVTTAGIPLVNLNTGGYLATITSALQSVFQSDVGGALKARITGLAAMTGTATVTLRAIPSASMVALDTALPTGSNTIGTVGVTGYPSAAASADGFANPTVTKVDATLLNYNGTTWDRVRNNWNVNTGDTGAKTVSVAGATQTNYNAAGANILINMGVVSGTTPTFTAQVQGSSDGGTTWFNIPGAVTTSITATGTYLLTVYPGVTVAANAAVSYPLPRTWRLNYTIGGTTPSFTITNVQVGYIN